VTLQTALIPPGTSCIKQSWHSPKRPGLEPSPPSGAGTLGFLSRPEVEECGKAWKNVARLAGLMCRNHSISAYAENKLQGL